MKNNLYKILNKLHKTELSFKQIDNNTFTEKHRIFIDSSKQNTRTHCVGLTMVRWWLGRKALTWARKGEVGSTAYIFRELSVGEVGTDEDDGVALELVDAYPFRSSSNSLSRLSSSESFDVNSLYSCKKGK